MDGVLPIYGKGICNPIPHNFPSTRRCSFTPHANDNKQQQRIKVGEIADSLPDVLP